MAKIGLIQVEIVPGSTMEERHEMLYNLAEATLKEGADLVFLPEAFQYVSCREIASAEHPQRLLEVSAMWRERMSALARQYHAYVVPWDYLFENGTLTRLTDAEVDENIPLTIETFGATDTIEKILSVPTTVSKAMTTFEDIKTIYDELAAAGITNVDFKLTGYANGGMYPTIPYKLAWEKSVGGSNGFEELAAYAKEKGFGVYPDFDFAYVNNHESFDGLKLNRDIVKTIDNRYSSLREYDASLQAYVSYYTLCVSPSAFSNFYGNFSQRYLKYENTNISLSTIGSALNSDFDEDEPYNRADAKEFTEEFLASVQNDMTGIMSEKGNAYTWKYVDTMLNVSL